MRIGIDVSWAQGAPSGTASYVEGLVEALARVEPQHEYVLFTRREQRGRRGPALPDLSVPNVRRVVVDAPLTNLRQQVTLPLALRRERLDLYHSPAFFLPLAWRGPAVVSMFDVNFLRLRENWQPGRRLVYLSLALQAPLAARQAARIITLSHASARDLARLLRVPPRKIAVVPAAPRDLFREVPDPADVAVARDRYGPFFLSVGVLAPQKNLERVLRAFAAAMLNREGFPGSAGFQPVPRRPAGSAGLQGVPSVPGSAGVPPVPGIAATRGRKDAPAPSEALRAPDGRAIKLVLAGQPAGDYAEMVLRPLARELGIEELVVFAGRANDAALRALYHAALALVYPSLGEGFGLPIVEAMACGCPVVTSTVSSMPEVAGDAALLVDPHDVAALSGALRDLLSAPALRADLAERGRARAALFTWDEAARQTLRCYDEAVGATPHPPTPSPSRGEGE